MATAISWAWWLQGPAQKEAICLRQDQGQATFPKVSSQASLLFLKKHSIPRGGRPAPVTWPGRGRLGLGLFHLPVPENLLSNAQCLRLQEGPPQFNLLSPTAGYSGLFGEIPRAMDKEDLKCLGIIPSGKADDPGS